MAITQQCPHCESRAVVEESRKVTRLVRELYFRCTYLDCGATFKSQLGVVAMISPSAMPHPSVILPSVPPRRKTKPVVANDDAPATDLEQA